MPCAPRRAPRSALPRARRTALAPRVTVGIEANTDRFVGGTADTAFGNVEMEPSEWNREARVSLRYTPSPGTAFSLRGGNQWLGDGERQADVGVRFSLRY